MTYNEYIKYHNLHDADCEERMVAKLCGFLALSPWEAFRLIYFYTMTYHLPSALSMLLDNIRDKHKLKFCTDRRFVPLQNRYEKLLEGLTKDKYERLSALNTTQEAYDEVKQWFYFGRFTAYLFLEIWCKVVQYKYKDDVKYEWEEKDLYTKCAEHIVGSTDRTLLDTFLDNVRSDTMDNAFAIETSLCAAFKMLKGTRWDKFYTERMLNDARGSKYETIIYKLAE